MKKKIFILALSLILLLTFSFNTLAESNERVGNYASKITLQNFIQQAIDVSYIKSFLKNNNVGSNVIRDIFNVMSVFSFWLFIIVIIIEMFKIVIFNQGNFATIVIKMLIVSILLTSYFPLLGIFIDGINFFVDRSIRRNVLNSAIFTTEIVHNLEEEYKQNELLADENLNKGKKNAWDTIKDFFDKGIKAVKDGILESLGWAVKIFVITLAMILTQLILIISVTVRNWYLILLIATGPLAIVSILLPGPFNVFKNWFFNFLYIILWPIFIGLILAVETSMMDFIFPGSGTENTFWVNIAHIIVLLFLIASSFTIIPSLINGTIGAGGTAAAVMGAGFMMARSFCRFLSNTKLPNSSKSPNLGDEDKGGKGGDGSPTPGSPNPSNNSSGSIYHGGLRLISNVKQNGQELLETNNKKTRSDSFLKNSNTSGSRIRHRNNNNSLISNKKRELSA